LQVAGYEGLIIIDQCEVLPALVAVCECGGGGSTTEAPSGSTLPSSAPSDSPSFRVFSTFEYSKQYAIRSHTIDRSFVFSHLSFVFLWF
jgi:hypothetical protein